MSVDTRLTCLACESTFVAALEEIAEADIELMGGDHIRIHCPVCETVEWWRVQARPSSVATGHARDAAA